MGTLLPLFHLPTVKEHMILGYQAIAVGNKTSKPQIFLFLMEEDSEHLKKGKKKR